MKKRLLQHVVPSAGQSGCTRSEACILCFRKFLMAGAKETGEISMHVLWSEKSKQPMLTVNVWNHQLLKKIKPRQITSGCTRNNDNKCNAIS